MKLTSILTGFFWLLLQGSLNVDITGVFDDSRNVKPGGVFICIRGTKMDGHTKIGEALDRGASALLTDRPVDVNPKYHPTIIQTPDTRVAAAKMAAAFYDFPENAMKIIGITGTKGKTTTAYMIKSILEASGCKTGLIGTVEIDDGHTRMPSVNTTPGALTIQSALARMRDNHVKYAVMEVSSQGLKQSRTAGIHFEAALLTNISKDHIGKYEHADMEEYMFCKSLLFNQCSAGLVNAADKMACRAVSRYEGRLYGFAEEGLPIYLPSDKIKFTGKMYSHETSVKTPQRFVFKERGRQPFEIKTHMAGQFNGINALGAAACARLLKIDHDAICRGLKEVNVRGRMEIVPIRKPVTVMIDYAHNAASLETLLRTVRPICCGKLICMFGCGGCRSKERRKGMGEVSARFADLTVVTTDNPRDEPPLTIMEDIIEGVQKAGGVYKAIENRKEAIKYCIDHAQKEDIVILAGKGHETYQEIQGIKYPLDEKAYLMENF
ncbi:MAG TPA: UDP-N-acetylmuramoyl-L-alanyl-D-glutamate--2,6-diaminopimelate ligase [Candidatus Scybalocola faecipullorum]|nr:UDP-N-acetylmuramoyl-L-alanyl-D-glutamate--2,6-diaminopimelate ligase [Candidatus Scybalocola faecipullorum]